VLTTKLAGFPTPYDPATAVRGFAGGGPACTRRVIMAEDPKHEAADDITPMMLLIGGLLVASMVLGYFLAW